MEPGEGMLVGSQSAGLFLVEAEVHENPYVASRPFRVNAGSLSMYTLGSVQNTRYLSELKAGDEVMITDRQGKARQVNVGRIKIEFRPLILIEAEAGDTKIKTVLQNAETIRLVTVENSKPVTQLKAGRRSTCAHGCERRQTLRRIRTRRKGDRALTIRICVSILPKTVTEASRLIKKAEEAHADFIEVRIDNLKDISEWADLADKGKVPKIATNRNASMTKMDAQQALLQAAKSGFEYVDIDLHTPNLKENIKELTNLGAKPIVSFHDLNGPLSISELETILEKEIDEPALKYAKS